jgi:hypothetical protein
MCEDIKRLIITGDTHGEQNTLAYIAQNALREGDALFVAGDFGFCFWGNKQEESFLNDVEFFLRKKNAYLLFVDGNHENHRLLNALPEESFCNARVHKLRPHIIHVIRGEILYIKGKKIFCFGGAFSIDRAFRELNVSYWEEELPTDTDFSNGNKNLKACGNSVDYIITHTCALSMTYSLNGRHDVVEERSLQNYLEWIRTSVSYEKWYFGHWHIDKKLWDNQIAVYYHVLDMETAECLLE